MNPFFWEDGYNICLHLKQLLEAEKPALKEEIEKNKYYLSEKAHYDVGLEEAQKDFIEHYLDTWAAGFKDAYCKHVCKERDDCDLIKGLIS